MEMSATAGSIGSSRDIRKRGDGVTGEQKPLRFYDNRQKYLSFVTTCNEKWTVAKRAVKELDFIEPTPPALRLFDAGMGDGTLLSHVMRAAHKRFPTVPLYVVGKEISLEDVRLCLEKLPDRLYEHPMTVFVAAHRFEQFELFPTRRGPIP